MHRDRGNDERLGCQGNGRLLLPEEAECRWFAGSGWRGLEEIIKKDVAMINFDSPTDFFLEFRVAAILEYRF